MKKGAVLWVILLALVALPVPIFLPGMDLLGGPEAAWPVLWFVLGGVGAAVWLVARVSVPFGVLLGWMLVRMSGDLFPLRSLEVFAQILLAAALWLVFVSLPLSSEPWALWALCVGVGVNAGLGAVNLVGWYPLHWVGDTPAPPFNFAHLVHDEGWAAALRGLLRGQIGPSAHTVGLPHGLLGHPNYWGAYMALGLPALGWAIRKWPPRLRFGITVLWLSLIAGSRSMGALLSASLVLFVAGPWLLPGWSHRMSAGLGVLGGAGIALWRGWVGGFPASLLSLGGRLPVWHLAWPQWLHSGSLWGVGLGAWRQWALIGPLSIGTATTPAQEGWAGWWVEAHSEPVQLLFELGLIGGAIGLWLGGTIMGQAEAVWKQADPAGKTWALMLVAAFGSMWLTIPFHLPALTVPILFAWARLVARRRDGVPA